MADPAVAKKIADALKSGATEEQILRIVSQNPDLREKISDEDVRYIAQKHAQLTGGAAPKGEIQTGRAPALLAQETAKAAIQPFASVAGFLSPGEERLDPTGVAGRYPTRVRGRFEGAERAATEMGKDIESAMFGHITPTGPTEELAAAFGTGLGSAATTLGPGAALRAVPATRAAGRFLTAQPLGQIAAPFVGEVASSQVDPVLGIPAGLIAGFLGPMSAKGVFSLLHKPFEQLPAQERKARAAIEEIAKRAGLSKEGLLAELDRLGPSGVLADIPVFQEQLAKATRGVTEKGQLVAPEVLPKLRERLSEQDRRMLSSVYPQPTEPARISEQNLARQIATQEEQAGRDAKRFFDTREKQRPMRLQTELGNLGPVQDAEAFKVSLQEQRSKLNEEARSTFLNQPVADVSGINQILNQSDTAKEVYRGYIKKLRGERSYAPVLPDDPREAEAAVAAYNDLVRQNPNLPRNVIDQIFSQLHPGKTIEEWKEAALGTKGLTLDIASRVEQVLRGIVDHKLTTEAATAAMEKGMASTVDKVRKDWRAVIEANSPEYAEWNAKLERLHSLESAVERGQEAAKKSSSPNVIRGGFVGTDDERRAFRAGYLSDMSERLGRGQEFAKLADDQTALRGAEIILGPDVANRFWDTLRREKEAAKIDARFSGVDDPKKLAKLAEEYAAPWGGQARISDIAQNRKIMEASERGRAFDRESPDTQQYFFASASDPEKEAYRKGVLETVYANPLKYGKEFQDRNSGEYRKYSSLFGEDATARLAEEARRRQAFGTTLETAETAAGRPSALAPGTLETVSKYTEPLAEAAVGMKGWPIRQLTRRVLEKFGTAPEVVRDPSARIPFSRIVTDPAESRSITQELPVPPLPSEKWGGRVMPVITGVEPGIGDLANTVIGKGGDYTFTVPGTPPEPKP